MTTPAMPEFSASHPAPTRSRRLRTLARGRGARSVGTVAAVLAAVVLAVNPYVMWPWESDPENLVRDYLAAVHDKRVDAALDLAQPFRNDPEEFAKQAQLGDNDFVAPEALSSDWRVVELAGTAVTDTLTRVDVTIGQGDRSVTGRFNVVDTEKYGWIIDNPYSVVNLGESPLPFIELNGKRSDVAPQTNVVLLPGVYQAYQSLDGFTTDEPFLTLPGAELGSIGLRLSDSGRAEAQRTVDSFLDECAESTRIEPRDCPFGVSSLDLSPEDVRSSSLDGITWTVTDYPELVFELGEGGFTMYPRAAGIVELSATGENYDGGTVEVSAYASVGFLRVLLTVDAFGAFTVEYSSW